MKKENNGIRRKWEKINQEKQALSAQFVPAVSLFKPGGRDFSLKH